MAKPSLSTTSRLAINVALVSLSVLLIAQCIGLFPDTGEAQSVAHLTLCESLAINCSILAARNDREGIESNLAMVVAKNPHALSAAFRSPQGEILAVAGDHEKHWRRSNTQDGQISRRAVCLPVMHQGQRLGELEVNFSPYAGVLLFGWTVDPWVRMVAMVTLMNMFLFMLYLRRMLKHLDPSRAVPNRVRSALDSLSEGLVILDNNRRILLANEAFLAAVQQSSSEVVGKTLAQFPWDAESAKFWSGRGTSPDAPLTLLSVSGASKLMVKSTRIMDEGGAEQGTLVTFSDVTVLEKNRESLLHANRTLEASRDKIQEQNRQLQILATRDPLTNCWNRRAFFEELHSHWHAANEQRQELCAIMFDIDHFKSVNDTYGHSMGDRVLRAVADRLTLAVRSCDYVCRYGGEEFCILLPGLSLPEGVEAAERFRDTIKCLEFSELRLTASLGVSTMALGANSPEEMLEEADKSLYLAKRMGRDQVVAWNHVPDDAEFDGPLRRDSRTTSTPSDPAHLDYLPFQVVTSLLSALSFRDPQTAAHSMRVADLSFMIGRGLLSASELYALEVAALLHDIGKIGVPDSILLKPGKLSDEEWEIMSRHSRMGFEIVESAFACEPVESILRSHHLPFGAIRNCGEMSGESIPLGARIMAIADAYDAMISDRVYRKGRTNEEAFAELRRCAGTQFDPELVERFIAAFNSQPFDVCESPAAASSKQLALHLGQSTDRIARAFDDRDLETLQAQAQRLIETARHYDNVQIEEIASRLSDAASHENEWGHLLGEVLELLEVCRATQRACLLQANAVRESLQSPYVEPQRI